MGFLKNVVSRLSENEHCWIWRVLIFGGEVPCGRKKRNRNDQEASDKKIGSLYRLRWMEREGKTQKNQEGLAGSFFFSFFSNIYIKQALSLARISKLQN